MNAPTPTLLTLPAELLHMITHKIETVSAILSLSSTCHTFRHIIQTSADRLGERIQQTHRTRLAATVAKLNFAGLPIHVALRRFLACCGPPLLVAEAMTIHRTNTARIFAADYLRHNLSNPVPKAELAGYVIWLFGLHEELRYIPREEDLVGLRPTGNSAIDDTAAQLQKSGYVPSSISLREMFETCEAIHRRPFWTPGTEPRDREQMWEVQRTASQRVLDEGYLVPLGLPQAEDVGVAVTYESGSRRAARILHDDAVETSDIDAIDLPWDDALKMAALAEDVEVWGMYSRLDFLED
ncbi:hypothetical protein LTR85_010023 [Meristemomyces frigidus]|nr:hypothetical protein LTR85_010023 [Meristemomyces frigidus]